MKKNILMIGTSFATQGGVSSVVKVYREAGLMQRQQIRYLETHRDGSKWRKLRYFVSGWLQFVFLLLTFQISLMHVHHSSSASFWHKMTFVLPAFLFRIPVVLHLHGGGFPKFCEDASPLVKGLVTYVYNKAACVIVLSKTWITWAESVCSNPNIRAVYNPVHVPPAVPFATREPATVLFLGRIGETKGSYDLLQACARLQQKYPELKVVFAGDGDQIKARELGNSLGLGEKLQLPGWINGAQKQQLLASASIYALPSYFEGLPMSILEAMAVGMPTVATPVGGIPEAVADGEDGFLVPARDIEAISAALDKLLGNRTLREQMGAKAREKVEKVFSIDCIMPQIESIYKELGVGK